MQNVHCISNSNEAMQCRIIQRVVVRRYDDSNWLSPTFPTTILLPVQRRTTLKPTSVGAACHLKRACRHSWRKPIIYTTLAGAACCVLASRVTISSWPLTSWRPARDMHCWPAYDQVVAGPHTRARTHTKLILYEELPTVVNDVVAPLVNFTASHVFWSLLSL